MFRKLIQCKISTSYPTTTVKMVLLKQWVSTFTDSHCLKRFFADSDYTGYTY